MARFPQPEAKRGSQKWIQKLVNEKACSIRILVDRWSLQKERASIGFRLGKVTNTRSIVIRLFWTSWKYVCQKFLWSSSGLREVRNGMRLGRPVSQISKFWNENGLWQTDAIIEYTLGGAQKRNVSFQINDDGEVVGFNLFEPIRG